jgi:ribose/xylose/arabinose/galactoside ABC-type transport system permease subunit
MSGFGYINPQIAAKQAANLITLPFLVWIVVSVYYLLRWYVRKTRFGHKKVTAQ